MNVILAPGKGSKDRGGGPGGHYWHVMADGQRAGAVFINMTENASTGPHASIQIFLNQAHQSKGIGRLAYRLACEASDLTTIYAHMRKSNPASQKAAAHAGFTICETPKGSQLLMVWRKGR